MRCLGKRSYHSCVNVCERTRVWRGRVGVADSAAGAFGGFAETLFDAPNVIVAGPDSTGRSAEAFDGYWRSRAAWRNRCMMTRSGEMASSLRLRRY